MRISDKEEFELAYRAFVKALKVIAEDPATQCKMMGNYNVAWELKDDATSGTYLLDLPGGKLSNEQKDGIRELLAEMNKIPNSVFASATSVSANKQAMNHRRWIPVREHASKLLRILQGP